LIKARKVGNPLISRSGNISKKKGIGERFPGKKEGVLDCVLRLKQEKESERALLNPPGWSMR